MNPDTPNGQSGQAKDLSQQGSPKDNASAPSAGSVAKIIGRSTTHTLTIQITEHGAVGRNDFLSITHRGEEYLLLCKDIWSEQGQTKGTCTVVGTMPRTPFNPDAAIYKATPRTVGSSLGIDVPRKEAVFVGNLLGRTIPIQLLVKRLGRLFVVGKTGSGKSYTTAVIMEEFLKKGIPIVVLDRHGEYSSLKIPSEEGNEKFNVTPRSYEKSVIEFADLHANPGADLPIEALLGTQPKDLVVSGQGTIINFRGLDLHVQEALSQEILTNLYQAAVDRVIPPFFCFVDEAHLLAPNRGKAATTSIMRLLAQEGRKFAANLIIITQKPQLLDTTVRSQVGTWIIHQLTDIRDVDIVVSSTEGLSREWNDDIQRLGTGQAIFAGDAVKVPLIVDVRTRETIHAAMGFNPLDYAEPQTLEEFENRRIRLRTDFASKIKASVERFQQLCSDVEGKGEYVPQRISALRDELQAAEQKLQELRDDNNKLAVRVRELTIELAKMEKKYKKALSVAERALKELKERKK
ncbi:MAG: helicase HerA domain-containing protein [Promethearchaeota archaeon]